MLATAHYHFARELAALQIATLAYAPAWAGADEGYEESATYVDLDATLDRIARHEATRSAPHAAYEQYVADAVDACRFANFTGPEIVAVHKRVTRSGVRNQLPPPAALVRLIVGLCIDQQVRYVGALPLRQNSLYRAPAYNKAIGGASRSQHLTGSARDRVLVGGTVAQLAQVDEAMEGTSVTLTPEQRKTLGRIVRDYDLGFYVPHAVTVAGGLGRYSWGVHRDQRGKRARW